MKKLIPIILALILMLCGCGKKNTVSPDNGDMPDNITESSFGSSDAVEAEFAESDSDMFTDRDRETEYNENDSILIELKGSSAVASSNSVKISGSTVTITENKTHIISGTLSDGMIIVNAPDTAKLQLVLNGVDITSKTSAALYILEADKVFVTLASSTKNTLSNGGTFTAIDDNNIDAAVFSKQDITFNGSGSLAVNSPAGHGIVSKDDLVITGGSYTVNAASHGLDANDSVRITDAAVTVDSGKDGIHAENSDDASLGFVYIGSGTLDIESEGDGISAGYLMQIEGGSIDVVAGGGSKNGTKESSDFWGGFMGGRPGGQSQPTSDDSSSSMKGLKAANSMLINDGTFKINSADDAVHSDISLTVSDGTFEIASGDDAFHAEETLSVTAGNINITECYEGLEALNVSVAGGNISMVANDDGINAAGGTDSSGSGGRDGMFGGQGRPGGGMSSSSNGSIVVSGGTLYIKMSGDGFDANGTLSITGGNITVSGADSGDTAILDFDSSGIISGGIFIGTGASGMSQNFSSSSTQGVIMAATDSNPSGTSVKLTDSNGNVIVSYTADRAFSCVILSHTSIVKGETYTLTVGSTETAVTMSSTVYGSGGSMGGNHRW